MRKWSFVRDGMFPEFVEMLNRDFADDQLLVMGQHQIAKDNPAATGQRITVHDAIERWGDSIIEEIIDKGAAIIVGRPENHE